MGRKKGKRKKGPYAKASPSATPDSWAGQSGQQTSLKKSLAQRRAAHALQQIKQMRNGACDNYVAYVKALPAAIIMSGLGQALAMEKAGGSKDGDVGAGHRLLYQHMDAWLRQGGEEGWRTPFAGEQDILAAIVAGNEEDYLRAQVEALEYLEWLKKFAVAYLEERGRE